jgi:hypothetical protein
MVTVLKEKTELQALKVIFLKSILILYTHVWLSLSSGAPGLE